MCTAKIWIGHALATEECIGSLEMMDGVHDSGPAFSRSLSDLHLTSSASLGHVERVGSACGSFVCCRLLSPGKCDAGVSSAYVAHSPMRLGKALGPMKGSSGDMHAKNQCSRVWRVINATRTRKEENPT